MLPGGCSNRQAEPQKAEASIARHKNDLVSNVALIGKKVEGEFWISNLREVLKSRKVFLL